LQSSFAKLRRGKQRSEIGKSHGTGRRDELRAGAFCIRSLPSFLIATLRDCAGHVARPSRSIDSLYPKAQRLPLAGLTVHLAPLPPARFMISAPASITAPRAAVPCMSRRPRTLHSALAFSLATFVGDQLVAAAVLARSF
jgi:hypothetical protein